MVDSLSVLLREHRSALSHLKWKATPLKVRTCKRTIERKFVLLERMSTHHEDVLNGSITHRNRAMRKHNGMKTKPPLRRSFGNTAGETVEPQMYQMETGHWRQSPDKDIPLQGSGNVAGENVPQGKEAYLQQS
ncbi:hypothetical protein M514_02148 [Trichuris suis]|uniref:Uncharacterized protein n=1 Tax=Trichuris suis TaxID=68888 RepID=A0A085N9I2_9BILA|nr:hypothetical protein M513_02148 [Trichuris suis]KFD66128.1 hypothetical protein M514_02148 [Trichuris suis]